MFSRPRKARVLFGISDILLVSLAFTLAYRTRSILHLEHVFFLTTEQMALVLGTALLAWVALAWWLEIYEKLDSGHPRVILRDAAKQCVYGALCLVVMEFVLRLELSRFFVLMFAALAWILLLTFRLTAGRVSGATVIALRTTHSDVELGDADAVVDEMTDDDVVLVKELVQATGFDHIDPNRVTKVASARQLYHFSTHNHGSY